MSLRNGFLRLVLMGICALTADVRAEQPETIPATGYAPVGLHVVSPQVLVLTSGRVVRGTIRSRGDGYVIDRQLGRMFVASSQVWVMADSLPEAYEKLKQSIQTVTPDVNMQLAAWCSKQRLWGTARRELLDALNQDPNREDARRMLAEVLRAQELAAQPSQPPKSEAVEQALQTGVVLPRRALGGLSAATAQHYMRQVQPLLSNTCAGCHHADSGRNFVMQSIRGGSTPALAEQNLAAVLAQLTPGDVAHSPLVRYATTAHGAQATASLRGRHAERHKHLLVTWGAAAMKEAGHLASGRTAAIAARTARLRPRQEQAAQTESGVVTAALVVGDSSPHETLRAKDSQVSSLLADAARRNRTDPFDPKIFNQRYRDGSASPDVSRTR